MQRRHFLATSIGALGASSSMFADSPNNALRVAVIGMGGQKPTGGLGRGGAHLSGWAGPRKEVQDSEIVAICDIDDAQLAKGLKVLAGYGVKTPETYKDIRKVIDNKDIDILSIATPNHWHTLMTIWGVQGGKDVYVEKPCSHNIFEAKQIVAAARKYDRIVQQGSQIRSSKAVQEAVLKMREGLIGDVYLSRGLCYKWRDDIGHAKVEPVPAGVDYDMWTGPSPTHPFTRNRFHYNWHWFWDTGNGDLGNQGIHQVDIARWGLGVKYPVKASAIGGHFMFDDDQETPNTLNCAWEFNESGKRKMMEFEVRHWMSNGEASVAPPKRGESAAADTGSLNAEGGGGGRSVPSDSIGALYYGSKGYLAVDSYSSYKSWLGKAQEPGPSGKAGGGHFANFADAVRSHDRTKLNAEIEEGAASTILVHLANISYRVGRTINFDPATLTITNDAEAAKMMTRPYRKGFVVPEKV
jgi:predicted dehydrogenase